MISNLIPSEATHSSLDLFEKPPLLVTFLNAFTQKIGPSYSPDGPMLKFEVLGDRNNFIDLQRTRLEIVARIVRSNGNVLRTHATEAANRDTPYFVNNPLSSLFSECTLSLNGERISTTKANFAHKGFIETEFSYGNDAKKTWLACQGYYYEENPSAIDGARRRADDVTERKGLVTAWSELKLFSKIACDFLSCDKHLLSGVTIRLSLIRSPNDFVVISEDAAKHYKVQKIEANLYVRKMNVTDYVLSSIEKTLLKNPAIYNYIEVVPKTFLATAGVQSWRQEDVFAKEPVRRMIVAMSINEAYLGTNRTNPFHYQKLGLNEIFVYRNNLPIAGTPISTSDNERIYYNTLEAFDFVLNTIHGISLANYDNHYIMAFDLTSTQDSLHNFIHPESTNCTFSVELKFDAGLGQRLCPYRLMYKNMRRTVHEGNKLLMKKPIQSADSVLCGLFCIYVAHVIITNKFPTGFKLKNHDLIRFAKHMLF